MTLEQAIKHAIDGKAVLFTGAGFSVGAVNLENDSMPIANGLCDVLSKDLGIDMIDDLDLVSDMYVTNKGSDELIKKLQGLYTCKGVGKTMKPHQIISELKWMRIYTTNYDDVFEKSSDSMGRKRIPITPLSYNPTDYVSQDVVLHLNGYINLLTQSNLMDEFKISRTSYLVDTFKKTKWLNVFESDLDAAHAIIFIGVSFKYDLHLQEIIYENDYKDKIIFIDKILSDKEEKDPTINYYKNKFGEVSNIGLAEFAKRVEDIQSSYKPNKAVPLFTCFNQLKPDAYQYKDIDSTDIRELLKYGDTNQNLVYFNRNSNEYLIEREEVIQAYNMLKDNKVKCVCFVSNLANGKTCAINILAHKLADLGKVFYYDHENATLGRELRTIAEMEGNKYVIIENYNSFLKLIRKIKTYIVQQGFYIILSTRTFIHDTTRNTLLDMAGISEIDAVDFYIDEISDDDRPKAIKLLERSDYFTAYRNLNNKAKIKMLGKNYDNQFNNILVSLIKSPRIRDEIKEIFKEIADNPIALKITISNCVAQVISIKLRISDYIKLLEINEIPASIRNNKAINQLIKFDENSILMRSSALARYILIDLARDYSLDIIKLMNNNSSLLSFEDKVYALQSALISFSNLMLINPHKTAEASKKILEYYYDLRDKHYYKNNPFFWLQYSIACLEVKDYERAESTFKIAYDIPKNNPYYKGFDSFQIDTQYARYLLEASIENFRVEKPYYTLQEAHKLLISVIRRKKGQQHLVYRQVALYDPFFKKYKGVFTLEQKRKTITYCDDFISSMNEYLNSTHMAKESRFFTLTRLSNLKELKNDIINTVVLKA